ncbi:MAG: hypothetical protein H7222_13925 [Methylotenera sp.]|nr:hypothetical protein [Oligoflexia bacterium]
MLKSVRAPALFGILVLAIPLLASHAAHAFDESINFQPGLNLYTEVEQMTDLFGAHGSQLCGPVSITHGMTYLKYGVGFKSLAEVKDLDHDGKADTYRDKIRYFFSACNTDRNTGTHYQDVQNCMQSYVEQSGYKAYSYMVGPHAINSPEGVPLETMKHVLTVKDVRTYVGARVLVLMGVGWYDYNATTRTYTRIGGHFFNVYGYDYDTAWGESHITLKAVNSLVNYAGRARQDMYDSVEMSALPQDGSTYPVETQFVLTGPGFSFTQKTLVEDLFFVLPTAPDPL